MKTTIWYLAAIAVGLCVGSWQVKSWQERHATLTIQCQPSAELIQPGSVTQYIAERERLLKSL